MGHLEVLEEEGLARRCGENPLCFSAEAQPL